MKSQKKNNLIAIIAYIVAFVFTLTVFSLHAIKGMHISSFWRQGVEQITIDPSLVNGVEISSYKCPKFMDAKGSTSISMSIVNKDNREQKTGVVLLVSKQGVAFNQNVEEEYIKMDPGKRSVFTWTIDESNVVDGKVSARLFLGKSPYHPMHSVRSCVILPWKGPLPTQFMNTWAYPILVLLSIVTAVWVYLKSGLDWQNKKRFFFFIFANVILLLMFFLLSVKMYMVALLALPFLFLGIIATFQRSPYIRAEEYKDYVNSKK